MKQADSGSPAPWRASFGPFTLAPKERLLERDGLPIRLGGRALDLLIVLVENAGRAVGKKELLERVWDGVVVDEGSLRFHMHAVRKALGNGQSNQHYIVSSPSTGYTFVARVERQAADRAARAAPANHAKSLPALSTALVGRDAEIRAIGASVRQRRLVTLVGPGGIGKTSAAIASAHTVASRFDGDVCLVDLSKISDPQLVRSTVASAVGLQNGQDDLAALAAHLAERRMLLVLDCCEHVVDGAAELAETLMRGCAGVHLLATSREPLGAQGEFVVRLPPLAVPPEDGGQTAADALRYPAVRLLVERAAASGADFELKDSDAALASRLCRELDGIALAIELVAGRVQALGLKTITSHLDASMKLMWHGRRTALPRHQTLGAALDWSFRLLNEGEKRLLCRLSVFAGSFSLEAATEVCGFDLDESQAVDLLASLVSKSLVNVDAGGARLRYGLLDTTKQYSHAKLLACGEQAVLAEKCAIWFAGWARRFLAQVPAADAAETLSAELPNLRAALEWHFGEASSKRIEAIELAASVCPLLLQVSRLAECARSAQMALARLPAELAGSRCELALQGALGQALMFTGGDGDIAAAAFQRSIEVAEHLQDFRSTLHLLNGYAVMLHRDGRCSDAVAVARKARALLVEGGKDGDDSESRAIADSLLGGALHIAGELAEAFDCFQRSAIHRSGTAAASKLGFDHHIRALSGMARTLWFTGQYGQARAAAEDAIGRAAECGHAVSHCIALIWAGSVFTYAGDLERQEQTIDTLESVARRHSLIPYVAVAMAGRGQSLIARGCAREGVERIRLAIEMFHANRYEMVTSEALSFMAGGLADLSLHASALATCDEAEAMIRSGGDFLRLPDLLTTRGRVLGACGRHAEAAQSWKLAIEHARARGMKASELRAVLSMARQLIEDGEREAASGMLRSVLDQAGDQTSPDLRLARSLL